MNMITQDLPRMGYFWLFKNDGGWVGNQIVKEQMKEKYDEYQSSVTHVAVSGGGYDIVEATYPYSKLSNILESYNGREAKLVMFDCPNYIERLRYKVAFFAASRSNLRYGLISLFFWKLNNVFTGLVHNFLANPKKPFCSFLASWALYKAIPDAEKMIGKKAEDCMPATFLTEHFKVVWEGIINKDTVPEESTSTLKSVDMHGTLTVHP